MGDIEPKDVSGLKIMGVSVSVLSRFVHSLRIAVLRKCSLHLECQSHAEGVLERTREAEL